MKQAWSKAWGDLSTDQQGKILHMRFGNPTQVPDSLHTEAMFDKLLKKNMLCYVPIIIPMTRGTV